MGHFKTIFLIFFCGALIGCNEQVKYGAIYEVDPVYDGFDREYREVLPFYIDGIKEAREGPVHFSSAQKPDRQFLGIDTYDLNDDGIKEIFVWVENPLTCGMNRCALEIYQFDHDGHLCVIETSTTHGAPTILSSVSNGYHDLAYDWWGEGKEFYIILRWDGKHYKLLERIPINQLRGMKGIKETLWQE